MRRHPHPLVGKRGVGAGNLHQRRLGGAEATVRASVQEDGGGSRVAVVSDLQIRGKAAQFGRGVLGDVAQRVMDQFAANLEARLVAGETPATSGAAPAEAAATPAATPAPATRTALEPADESLDALPAVALPMLRRAAPAIGAFLLGVVVGLLLHRRRHDNRPSVTHETEDSDSA